MVNKTENISSYNQEILNDYGHKLWNKMKVPENRSLASKVFDTVTGLFTTYTVGYQVGEQIAVTHGATCCNRMIDLVVGKFFKQEPKVELSYWQRLKRPFADATQRTLSETVKLTVTPKVMQKLPAVGGIVGGLTLTAAIGLMSLVYEKYLNNPSTFNQLEKMNLEELFQIDTETGRLRDVFGNVLSDADMERVRKLISKYDLICQLSQLPRQEIRNFVEKHLIVRNDGKVLFPDGHFLTEEEKLAIEKGIKILVEDTNPTRSKKDIHAMIKLLASHSSLPTQVVDTPSDIKQENTSARLPPIFSGENEWKNSVIRCQDGKYCLTQDSSHNSKGMIVSKDQMNEILEEVRSEKQENAEFERLIEEFVQIETSKDRRRVHIDGYFGLF